MTREKHPLQFNSSLEVSIETVLVPMESEETEISWQDKYFCTLCKQEIENNICAVPHNLMQCLQFFLGQKK